MYDECFDEDSCFIKQSRIVYLKGGKIINSKIIINNFPDDFNEEDYVIVNRFEEFKMNKNDPNYSQLPISLKTYGLEL